MRVIGEQRNGDINLNVGSNGQTVVEESHNYIVEADSKFDTMYVVAQCPGLPQVGLTYSSSGLAVCKSVTGNRRPDNPKIWDFTCNFSSEVDQNTSNPVGPNTDPEAWIPIRRTLFEKIETQEFKDLVQPDGQVIANSAGEPFANGITRIRHIPVWEFDQFEPITISDIAIIERSETVNDATYLGFAKHTLLCRVMDSVVGFYYGRRRRLTKYRISYNARTWYLDILDHGNYYRDANWKKVSFVTDDVGRDFVGFLNGFGGKLDTNPPGGQLNPSDFKYKRFQMYKEADFKTYFRF
jgi:hypothetical protein